MTITARVRRGLGGAALVLGLTSTAWPQAPTIEPGQPPPVDRSSSTLGPTPGAGSSTPLGEAPGGEGQPLGGGVGSGRSRAPSGIATPPTASGVPPAPSIALPSALPGNPLPVYGLLDLPATLDADGPADGLTLDQAIERLVRVNLDLRSKFFEIPQADADILTARLRANPILYADAQLVPYGAYGPQRPGGQTQYDINVSIPLDLTRKRQARTLVARQAKRVLEAQYQDAVRLTIDHLYTVHVDILAARETVRFARASVESFGKLLEVTRELRKRGDRTSVDVRRVEIQRETAALGLADAEEGLRRARRALGVMLDLPDSEAEGLEWHGSLRDDVSEVPPCDQLLMTALTWRPDLTAYRLGIRRAEADVRYARASRLSDVYLMYQPYTFQDNAPQGLKSPHSWAVGVTVPLPVFNRNQGTIERARLNVAQTQVEVAAVERRVQAEVRQAEQEYRLTRAAMNRIERELLPAARQVQEDTYRLFTGGETDVTAYLNARRDFNEVLRQYRDTAVRHRRSMLALNTAVGVRILP